MRKLIIPLAAVALAIGHGMFWRPEWDIAISIAPFSRGFPVELVAAALFVLVVGALFVMSKLDHSKGSRQ